MTKATAAILELLAARPALALFLTGDAPGVEPAVVERYRKLLIPAVAHLWERAGASPRPHMDPSLAFGRAQVLIFHEIAAGEASACPSSLPDIVYLAIAPFAGHDEALRAGPRSPKPRSSPRRSSEPVSDGPPDLRKWRLPRGRHGLPRELVTRSQRERLLAAVVRATAAKGYEATTVADILDEAGVGRETFYELFDDKRDCVLAAHQSSPTTSSAGARAPTWGRASGPNGPATPWRRRSTGSPPTRRRPASCWSSWARSAPSRGSASRGLRPLRRLLDDGLEEADCSPDVARRDEPRGRRDRRPRLRGGRAGRAAELPQLLPELTYELLVPFLGEEAARAEQVRAIASGPPAPSGDR